jgi:hypothetical protein
MLSGATLMQAQEPADYYTISGTVRSRDSRNKLENVNVSVEGTNIGTVTNADGVFSLKVKSSVAAHALKVTHIGFLNATLSLSDKQHLTELDIRLVPVPNSLRELVVYGTPELILTTCIAKIADNYSATNTLSSAFYRETVQKRRRYISVSEAVMNIFKTDYTDRDTRLDRVQLLRGRRLLSQRSADTLAVKVAGGPNLALFMDMVKNAPMLLNDDMPNYYALRMEEPESLDERVQYVISFQPKVLLPYSLFSGKLYIDAEHLSLTRAAFDLDLRDMQKAISTLLYKKPVGLRFRPQAVSYLVTYKTTNGRTHLNYMLNTLRFKCDWKRRWFSATYTVRSEMVVTDREDNYQDKIAYRDAFRERQVFYDMVDEYWDEDFWKAYNIIEPTESLEHAVERLMKR